MRTLLEKEKVDVNKGGGINGSPLHIAVVRLMTGVVRVLLQRKSLINPIDNMQRTPLFMLFTVFDKNPT